MKRKAHCFFLILLFAFAAGFPAFVISQNSSVTLESSEKIWSLIEIQVTSGAPDTSYNFILKLVRDHCRYDTSCLVEFYGIVVYKLELSFNLPAAIVVAKELVKISQQKQDFETVIKAYRNLSRFYNAMGSEQPAVMYNEKALDLSIQTGNQHAITISKMTKLEQRTGHGQLQEVLPEMDLLLKQVVANGDSLSVEYLNARMVQIKIAAGLYEEASRHIAYIEKLPVPDPVPMEKYGILIAAALGRADLAMAGNDLNGAEPFLQKALRLCEAQPSRWLEIHILRLLSELEWKRGNTILSKSYIEKALVKAEKLHLDDLLATIYKMKADIAESEKRYADALGYTKKMYLHQERFEKRKAGFDALYYHLHLEKDQLMSEKKKQEQELKLEEVKFRDSLIILALMLFLVLGLSIGIYRQSKGKKQLAGQNALILQQTEKLKNLDQAKSRFFANVSHELRTPLSLILGPLGSLSKEENLSEKQSRLLGIAFENAKLMKELVTEILDLAKLEMGKMELNEKPTFLYALFQGCCSHFESLASQKKVVFSVKTLVNEDLVVKLDQGKFRQILFNLLSNAFKFTSEGERVEITLTVKDGFLQVEVSDTGQGIHPDDLPHLFDRYFQTTRPDKPAEGGTGIGLALCQEYARLLGGKTEVESTLGEGTRFCVRFLVSPVDDQQSINDGIIPIPDSTSEVIFEDNKETPQTEYAGRKVEITSIAEQKPTLLIVEDNISQQEYLELILSGKYNLVNHLNGKAALDYLVRNNCCDLIISDLMMPVMDGYQLLERLKSEDITRHIPVIMLTGRADTGSKLKALRIGVDDYLIKPYDEDELLVRIENLLKNQAARHLEIQTEAEPTSSNPALSKADLDWLTAFEDYIRNHLNDDTLSVPSLAREFAMSESSLLRQLRRLTGLPPVRYMQEMRLIKARQLLEDRSYSSISSVAYEVGYANVQVFTRNFKNRFGRLPSDLLD